MPSAGTTETVYLFGPQVLSFNKDVSSLLYSTLNQKANHKWVRTALSQLPQCWDTILSDAPSLKHSPGRVLLTELREWIDTGSFSSQLSSLPSILLTPLVVALQLSQYISLLEVSYPEQTDRHQANLAHLGGRQSVAFCTGILSAIAVSASENDAQLQQYGSAAIRVAMLIGAVVDNKDAWGQKDKQSTSISLGWNSCDEENQIKEVLHEFSNTYISVLYDEKRATVTTSATDLESLTMKLKGLGITVTDVSLNGRFHFSGHEETITSLNEICDSNPAFRLPSSSALKIPLLSDSGENFRSNSLHLLALRSILIDRCEWYKTLSSIQNSALANAQTTVYSFGLEQCIPPTIMRKTRARLVNTIDVLWRETSPLSSTQLAPVREDSIAVVGMACKVAGADDIDEFWSLLREGKSQHVEVPDDRIHFGTHWREPDKSRKWYANLIRDPDAFDHRFFKKSPREMMSTDPQQRWMMQIAYQAVEQSGYFQSASPEKHIGCYLGVGCIDYENNIACHPANAFSATGNLKSFVAGKISHWFGWTGPSMTIDTACSASAVAIHQACKAILSGDCNAAVAGGVTIMTSPQWFQNLAGGGFLSPTGSCKPFDADADGYCRGEGIGAVFLKKLSTAIADGDQILGVLPATAVYQNINCTPITVPNAESLSDLFRHVTNSAGLEPKQISVVEAHGTGTPVGDPAEYESVRRVFGGSRPDIVSLGSVKGLIGHTETASGIMSLIKVLLMINEGAIPPQASFKSLSPSLKASAEDNMEVSKSLKIWDSKFRAALINNYGASGSNASMVVTQAPQMLKRTAKGAFDDVGKFPFWLCGYDDQSLRDYVSRLLLYLRDRKASSQHVSLADISFNVSRQSNRTLKQALVFSGDSVSDLEEKLAAFQSGNPRQPSISCQPPRPVVFCFGGQVSTFVGLDRELYSNVAVLRKNLDRCDAVIQSNGLPTIYPNIFLRDSVTDPALLQVMLFACQYSCAKTWIDCGVTPAAVVGHSFGELVALCISGVLSLENALQIIIGRAIAIRECWGNDKGAMMAVEGVEEVVHQLLQQANQYSGSEASIACYNGPRSFTLAGTSNSIDVVADMIATTNSFSSLRSKRLNVTNAFHSVLVDALKPRLEEIGRGLTFNDPIIPIELATESETSPSSLSSSYVAKHMRDPVYFNHAVQRLSKKHPSAIWLECGSNSTITNIACRALGNPVDSHFQPVNITSNQSLNLLTDATLSLWKQGLNVTFWRHHAFQTTEYQTLLLPPYQFAKTRHWVELKKPELAQAIAETPDSSDNEAIVGLWSFIEYRDNAKSKARFRINTMTEEFQDYVRGHTIAQAAPLCPSTLQLSIVIDALMHLNPSYAAENYHPQLSGLDNHQPICIDSTKAVWLDVVTSGAASRHWDFRMVSTSLKESSSETLHVSGAISFRSADDIQLQREFARYEHLSDYQRCRKLLEDPYVSDIIQGRNIYRTFSEIVDYAEPYQGLTKIVGSELKSAGRVVKAHTATTWLDTHLADSFCQTAGIFVNCMTDSLRSEIAISTKIEQWIRSPRLRPGDPRPETWDVLALHRRPSDKEWMSDVFIFDPRDGSLVEVILGIGYQIVSRASLGKLLSRLTNGGVSPVQPAAPTSESVLQPTPMSIPVLSVQGSEATQADKHEPAQSDCPNIYPRMLELVCGISGLEAHEIQPNTQLPDIGIDSLVGMELAREIEGIFKVSLDPCLLMEVDDMMSLTKCVEKVLGIESVAVEMKPIEDPRKDSAINGYITPAGSSDSSDWRNDESGIMTPPEDAMKLEPEVILESFAESKAQTDNFIAEHKFGGYADHVLPKQTELCVAHIAEAFEELGCSLRVSAGTPLARVPHVTKQKIPVYVDYIYEKILCKEARIIEFRDSRMVRTATPLPVRSVKDLLSELIKNFPDHENDHRLIYLAGSRLAECLSGKTDGVRVIFGSAEGRDLVSGLYGRSPINMAFLKQMEDFTRRIISRMPKDQGPLKILEMGAGTGGTTAGMAKLLETLNVPVEYTFTDLSPSLVAAAGRRFKEYPFLKFQTHDIEKAPPVDLVQSQHIVIANNCVHATQSLYNSMHNIHTVLRPDGVVMILEMTETLYWCDLVFGLLEGWWLFGDDRQHVVAHQTFWEQKMLAAGYGQVDWTEGQRPEADLQRIIIALASKPEYASLPVPPPLVPGTDLMARQKAISDYVSTYSEGLDGPIVARGEVKHLDTCVLVTGGTGSLGAHLVAHFASLPDVKTVVCLNRRSSGRTAQVRQRQEMESKGITMTDAGWSKLQVFEADTSKTLFGLTDSQYAELVRSVTHIVHSAWPMSVNKPVKGFEPQFRAMRNLIQLAREAAGMRNAKSRISFQFISSIATVGLYPVWSGRTLVPEERMTINSILASGYSDAKFICEQMLDETLHKSPSNFRAMAVRIGQIAGSKTSGYWNRMEHLAFLLKSSQTLNALPQFDGTLSWCPVNDVAATLSDLLLSELNPYPMYHVENPVRQSWKDMTLLLADCLNISRSNTVPMDEWVRMVRNHPEDKKADNPAIQLLEFLESHHERMNCGGLVMATRRTRAHSKTLAALGPVSDELVRKYVEAWKDMGFLKR